MGVGTGISLVNAGVNLGGKPILSDLTLTLTEPRIGIAGRNGSGKTTLLRLMAGLIAPTTGSVTVEAGRPTTARRYCAALASCSRTPITRSCSPPWPRNSPLV